MRSAVTSFGSSSLLLGLPMSLLFLSQLTDFLVLLSVADAQSLLFFTSKPVQADDPRRLAAEGAQKTFQAVLYLFVFLMCALNWRTVYTYLRQWPHLVLIIALLLFGTTYSTEPVKVVTNSILMVVAILMPLAFAIGQKDSPNRLINFYWFLLIPFVFSHFASLVLLMFYGVDPLSMITSPNRYGGFSGNPNSLGNSAVIGVWVSFAVLLSEQTSRKFKIFAVVSALIFANSIALSGSGTALAVSILVVGLLLWMRFLSMFSNKVRGPINVFSGAFLVCAVLSILVLTTPAEIFLLFTGSLGKDATLTGRTELWDIAKDAVAQRPWLGWSFDSHTSVKSYREYYIDHNHYHNGFLDTLINGGVVLLLLVLYNLSWFVRVFLRAFRRNQAVFALAVPGIMIVILNISEYSLLRPLSEIWQLYTACFILLTYRYTRSEERHRPLDVVRKRRKKSMRWA